MEVEVITIGDELLIGQVVNTNAAWLGRALNGIGAELMRVTTVRDRMEEMLSAVDEAFSRVNVVLLTGGLGPTKDDLTKEALCRYFRTQLRFDEAVLRNIEALYMRRGRPITESTRTQALVPETCEVIQNRLGSAPIMWFERENRLLVSMPGVPYEMEGAMERDVLPRLERRFLDGMAIVHATCWVKDYSESALSEFLEPFERALPESVKLAYLPAAGVVRLRLTARGYDGEKTQKALQLEVERLDGLLGRHIFSHEDRTVSEIVGRTLAERGLTVSVAESCTGGELARTLVETAGSSAYFRGGVVAYANEAKTNTLGVPGSLIASEGAVSAPVVEEMCRGARRLFGTDCAIATSGIAGPAGGSEEKPVGTVWIAACCGERFLVRHYLFGRERKVNMVRASQAAALLLLELLADLA